ncbi:MAG: ParA family protein [Pseudothermotoga sp.]|uniref:ParA family protein n=1 Tax=Pseudothermotoga sp. TaxID=2033661 RepID=UPI000EE5778C|nr:ParA family protein [Pseudothermotoga sp.]HCO97864.1 ParA family protein [Pseudothermotoga sp.]
MAKTLAFANLKGGTGKTTLCYNLAALLTDMGQRTLLVDLDAQAHATTHAGFEPLKIKKGVFDAIDDYLEKHNTGPQVLLRQEKLFILPSNPKTVLLEEKLESLPNKESVLKDFLVEFDRDFDFILIDTPPSLGLTVLNALVASQYLLIPVKLDFFSLVGLAQMINFYYKVNATFSPYLRLLGLIPISISSRANVCKDVMNELRTTFGERLLLPTLRNDIKVVEASSHGLPVHRYAPKSRATEDLTKIAREIMRRLA